MMLTEHNTYNALHRGKTFLGFPLLPTFSLLLICLLSGTLINMFASFPHLGFLRYFDDVDFIVFVVGALAFWIIEHLDFHAFGLLGWQARADFRNGTKRCHHYVAGNDDGAKTQAMRYQTFSQKLPQATLTAHSLQLDNGTVLVGVGLNGNPYCTADDSVINSLSQSLAECLAEIDSSEVTVRLVHHHAPMQLAPLENRVRSPFEKVVRMAAEATQKQNLFYGNNYALLLSQNVLSDTEQAIVRRLKGDGKRLSKRGKRDKMPVANAAALQAVTEKLLVMADNIVSAGSDFAAKPLTGQQLLSWARISLQAGDDKAVSGKHVLTQRAIDIGDAIYFYPTHHQDERFAACISLLALPDKTVPNVVLSDLQAYPAEFLFTHAGQMVPNDKMKNILKWTKNVTGNTLGDAGGDSEELTESSERAHRGIEHFFKMQHTLTVYANSREALAVSVRGIERIFKRAGFVVRNDKFFLNTLFFSQVPGCESRLARSLLMTKEVVAAISLPLQSQTNQGQMSHLPSAVMHLPTLDNALFALHCHETQASSTPETEPTPGTIILVGPNGSGKTIFQEMLMHALGRFGGKTVLFDNDNSQTANVLASGGVVNVIHPDSKTLSLNPFLMPNTSENRAFLTGWLTRLCLRENENHNAALERDISDAIDLFYTMGAGDPTLLTLSHFVTVLGKGFSRHDELRALCHTPYEGTSAGNYAFLFDNANDSLDFTASVVSFEMTWILNDTVMPLPIRDAFFAYLFYRLKQFYGNDMRLTSVFVEEAHQVFKSEHWQAFLVGDIPRDRKKNVQWIFGSQMPDSLLESAVGKVLSTNYAYFYAFANNGMNEAAADAYRAFGFSDSEMAIIDSIPKNKRLVLVKPKNVHHHSELVSTHVALGECFPILQGGRQRAEVMHKVKATLGDDAPITAIIDKFNEEWSQCAV